MDRYKQTLSAHIRGPRHFFVILRFDQPKKRENTDLVKTWREKKPQ